MLFNSFSYAWFLPAVFAVYWLIPDKYRWLLILLSSYYFYMSWNPKYVVLILGITIVSYAAALMLEKIDTQPQRRIIVIITSLICFSVLFVFKYYNWFASSLASFLSHFSLNINPVTLNFILPVGISFYTFQTLSYVIDVYRKEIKAERDFGTYAAFVSFFPQLVAGPIERANNLLPQIKSEKKFDSKTAEYGLKLIAWGLFKKMCIADRIAPHVDLVYNSLYTSSTNDLLFAVLGFSIQIYCDFSGYSDIAIGSAKLLGINLSTNFSSPYYSASIKEFWSRWHISLSSWFRDYLYIPLGGNRCTNLRRSINLFITFLISGLWHGASWTFVVWGGIHGLGQIIENYLNCFIRRVKPYQIVRILSVIIVFTFCNLAWVFFRAESLNDAFFILSHLALGFSHKKQFVTSGLNLYELLKIGLLLLALGLFDLKNKKEDAILWISEKNVIIRWTVYTALIFLLFLFAKTDDNAFIYFQF